MSAASGSFLAYASGLQGVIRGHRASLIELLTHTFDHIPYYLLCSLCAHLSSQAEKALERIKAEGLIEKPFVAKKRSFTFPPVEKMGQKVGAACAAVIHDSSYIRLGMSMRFMA